MKPIGVVHSPFKRREDIDPTRNVCPNGFADIEGQIEIFKPYAAGLKDIAALLSEDQAEHDGVKPTHSGALKFSLKEYIKELGMSW